MTVFGHPPSARGRTAAAGACAAIGAISLSLLAAGCGSQRVTAGSAASSGPGSSASATATGPSGAASPGSSSASPAPSPGSSAPASSGGSAAPGAGSTVNPGGPMAGFPVASPEAQVAQLPSGATYIAFSAASRSANGMTLYLTFEAAGGACGMYDAVAQQTSTTVSVGIAHLPKAAGVMCPMYITVKELEVQLSAPLGSRPVVDLANGRTVDVVLAGGVPGAAILPRIPAGPGTERGSRPF